MAEDNGIDADVLVALLDATNSDARVVTSILDAELALATDDYDVLLLDLGLPDAVGLDGLGRLAQGSRSLPVIVITAEDTDGQLPEQALRAGAEDYLVKGQFGPSELCRSIRYSIERHATRGHHRELEERLRRAEKMEAIGRLAGGVAHDFNNLLMVITGYAELLESRMPSKEVKGILNAAEQAAAVTQQLLAFSRTRTKGARSLDLNEAVADASAMLERLLGGQVDLKFEPAPEDLFVVFGPGQIQQIVLNLGLNARDAMPEGGTIRLTTRLLADDDPLLDAPGLRDGRSQSFVCLTASDTGDGLSAENIERIFEPFYTTKEVGHGTGLGLSTVFGLAQQAGGIVTVDSDPGRGANFHVILPRTDRKIPARLPSEAPGAGDERLLLLRRCSGRYPARSGEGRLSSTARIERGTRTQVMGGPRERHRASDQRRGDAPDDGTRIGIEITRGRA